MNGSCPSSDGHRARNRTTKLAYPPPPSSQTVEISWEIQNGLSLYTEPEFVQCAVGTLISCDIDSSVHVRYCYVRPAALHFAFFLFAFWNHQHVPVMRRRRTDPKGMATTAVLLCPMGSWSSSRSSGGNSGVTVRSVVFTQRMFDSSRLQSLGTIWDLWLFYIWRIFCAKRGEGALWESEFLHGHYYACLRFCITWGFPRNTPFDRFVNISVNSCLCEESNPILGIYTLHVCYLYIMHTNIYFYVFMNTYEEEMASSGKQMMTGMLRIR